LKTDTIPYGAERDGIVNYIEISGWLDGWFRRYKTAKSAEYLHARLYLGEYGVTIIIKVWINNDGSGNALAQRALSLSDGQHIVVTGRLYVSQYRGVSHFGINVDSIT